MVYLLVEYKKGYDYEWIETIEVYKYKKDAERVIEINPHRDFEILEREIKLD